MKLEYRTVGRSIDVDLEQYLKISELLFELARKVQSLYTSGGVTNYPTTREAVQDMVAFLVGDVPSLSELAISKFGEFELPAAPEILIPIYRFLVVGDGDGDFILTPSQVLPADFDIDKERIAAIEVDHYASEWYAYELLQALSK